jgi:hypothetical protein
MQYTADAIDYCHKLYLRHNGQQHKLIEKEMHKAGWTGWRANYLYSTKKKIGWVEKYGWKESLLKHLEQKAAPALDSAEKLVREIEEVRTDLAREIKAKGASNVDDERLRLHVSYCNLSISALTKVEAARDTLSGWVSFWERLVDWAVDVDAKLARKLVDNSNAFIKRAEKEFGEEVAVADETGTSPTVREGSENGALDAHPTRDARAGTPPDARAKAPER